MAFDQKVKMEMRQCLGCTAIYRVLTSSTQDFCSQYCRNETDGMGKPQKLRPPDSREMPREQKEIIVVVNDEPPKIKELRRTYASHRRFRS